MGEENENKRWIIEFEYKWGTNGRWMWCWEIGLENRCDGLCEFGVRVNFFKNKAVTA
jgi:hypothetical protein